MRAVLVQSSIGHESLVQRAIHSAWPQAAVDIATIPGVLRGDDIGPMQGDDFIVVHGADAGVVENIVRRIGATHPQAIIVAVGAGEPTPGTAENNARSRAQLESIMAAGAAAYVAEERITPGLLFTLISAARADRERPAAPDATMHRFLWQADAWPDEPLSPEKLAEAELEHAAAPAPDAAVDDDFVDDALSFTAPWRSEELEPPAADQYFWLTAPWRDAGADAGQSDGESIEIAGYRVVRQLGTGGMSTVWLARRESDGMEVVLKVLARSLVRSKVQLQRFMREYRLIANINSRSVVKIYDQGTVDDRAYIAMEYFPGGDLRQKLGEPIPPGRALKLLWSIARALHSIHARGIVHRDLKPANIMFRADGSVGLVDFGVSRRKQVTGNTVGLTLTGELLGTPLYMSPEQGRGLRATPQSDLYSLGVIFHEMLTGEYPFTDKSLMVIIHKHAVDPIPRLPRILAAYQEMHDTLLAKDAADRFSSARALLSYMREKFGN